MVPLGALSPDKDLLPVAQPHINYPSLKIHYLFIAQALMIKMM
jgi:hypothetical protein